MKFLTMRLKITSTTFNHFCSVLAIFLVSYISNASTTIDSLPNFNLENDLLLVQFDCKTDVDDLHAIAAFRTLIANPQFLKLNYFTVAGTYGIQEGLYVPPNELFEIAFEGNWADAHQNSISAVNQVLAVATVTLQNEGDIWIAEAGQSDFTAALIKTIQEKHPEINTSKRIHVVQHSEWNESVTAPEKLQFVKTNSDYTKIPDGNAVGNGTPGFRDPNFHIEEYEITNPLVLEIWTLAIETATNYNGKDGRYNNEAIAAGGLDFSDLSEVCWILGIAEIIDVPQFFNLYVH
jgi:hypothetical protein